MILLRELVKEETRAFRPRPVGPNWIAEAEADVRHLAGG